MTKSTNLGRDLGLALTKIIEDVTQQAYSAATETELIGIDSMRNRIESAVTPWGSARQAGLVSGPKGAPASRESAGRIETGEMYDKVTGVTEQTGQHQITITWGWEDREDFERYFRWQEHGTQQIEAMESLWFSSHDALEDLEGRLRRIR